MELRLNEHKTFYMLEKRKKDDEVVALYDNLDEAIRRVAEYIKQGTPTNSIGLTQVFVEKDGLRVIGMPWSQIAEKLVTLK